MSLQAKLSYKHEESILDMNIPSSSIISTCYVVRLQLRQLPSLVNHRRTIPRINILYGTKSPLKNFNQDKYDYHSLHSAQACRPNDTFSTYGSEADSILRLSEEPFVAQQWMNRLNRRAENLKIDRFTNYPEQDPRHSWFAG